MNEFVTVSESRTVTAHGIFNTNAFMTGEQSYKYYNEFMGKGRYAECISVEEMIKRMKG